MRGRILLVPSAEPRRGRARPAARQPPAVVLRRRVGVPRRRPTHDGVVRPASSSPTTSTGALRPYVVYRLLEAAFGIRSYWPYIGLAILLHLVVVHLVWRADAAGPDHAVGGHRRNVLPLLVLGAGSQNLLWAFQIGFLGSVALGLGTMLLVNHAGAVAATRLGRHSAWPSSRCSGRAYQCSSSSSASWSCCCGGGSSRRAFAIAPAIVYIVWALATRLRPPSPRRRCGRSPNLWPFVATGLSTAADAFVLDAPLLGSVCLLLLFGTSCAPPSGPRRRPRWRTRAPRERSPSSSSRRTAGGNSESARPGVAYGYIAIILLAPAIAMAADRLLAVQHACRAGFVVVFLLLVVANAHLLRSDASYEAGREAPIRGLILRGRADRERSSAEARAGCRRRAALLARPDGRRSPPLRSER